MGRFEVSDMERPSVALEAMAECCERAVNVHPLREIGKNLLASLVAVQRFQLLPLVWLSLPDEIEHYFGENGPLTVEAVAINGYIAVGEKMSLDDGFKSELRV